MLEAPDTKPLDYLITRDIGQRAWATMPGLKIRVGISEALEVRGGPLKEEEVWALLYQCSEALQYTFIIGEAVSKIGHPAFVITPETLMLCGNGTTQFMETPLSHILDQNYIPPEFYADRHYQDVDVEKMYVFMLGMSLYNSVDYQLREDQELELSSQLDAALSSMCEENPTLRHSLSDLLQACSDYNRSHPSRLASIHHIINLYKLVLGSSQELDSWYDQQFDTTDIVYKPTRRNQDPDFKPRSRSHSHNRARSRSRSREGSKQHRERPHPVGRDFEEPYHRSLSNLHVNKTPVPHGSRTFLPATEPFDRRFTNRRVMSEVQLNRVSPHLHTSNLSLGAGTFEMSPGRLTPHERSRSRGARSVQETYDHLRDRRQKLQALRYGLSADELDDSDAASLFSENTDYGDGKSMISANSYTQGIFQPDLMSQYGSQVALQLGRDGDDLSDWIHRHHGLPRPKGRVADTPSRGPIPPLSLRAPPRSQGASPAGGVRIHDPSGATTPRSRPQSRPNSAARSKSRDRRPHIASKPREHPGPEFVRKAGNAEATLRVPFIKNMNPSNIRNVRVVLLSGQKLNIFCEPSTTGKQIFDCVVSLLGLPEHYFFGITFLQDGEHFFLSSDTKLQKIAPQGWKDGKGKPFSVVFTLFFRVKFYVNSISMMKHQMTRHLVYLQLRRDVLEERLWCTDEECLKLASLALQAEYGDDYEDQDKMKYFMCEHYVSPRCLRRLGSAYIKDNLPTLHNNHYGMEELEAELAFIKEAQHLPEYGTHNYKIYKSKKDMIDPLYLGINVNGILVAEGRQADDSQRRVVTRHPWAYTQKISFHRSRFSILPKTDAGPHKPAKMNFHTDSYKKGRYFVQLCTGHHSFQMRMKSRDDITDIINQEFPKEAGGGDDEGSETEFDLGAMEDYGEENDQSYQAEDDMGDRGYANFPVTPVPSGQKPRYASPNSLHQRYAGDSPMSARRDPSGHVFITDDRDGMLHDTSLSNDLSALQSQKKDGPDRRVLVVELKKEPNVGVGIDIVGGENMGKLDLGIFIESVIGGGPAARDGRIRPGDRIIAINGESLEGMPHHVAVEMIRQSPPSVQLMLSQSTDPIPADYNGDSDLDESLEDITVSSQVQVHQVLQQERSVEGHEGEPSVEPAQRPSTSNSSDLDIDRVLPPQALKQDYIEKHMTPSTLDMRRPVTPGGAAGTSVLQDKELVETAVDDSDSEIDEALRNIDERSRKEGYILSTDLTNDSELTTVHPDPGEQFEVVLKKYQGSLGLNVTGGINTSVKHGGIYVKSYNPPEGSKTATEQPDVRPGDRVMEANGIRLIGVTHKQAVETLRNSPDKCHLVLVRGNIPAIRETIATATASSMSSEVSGNSPNDEMTAERDSSIPDYGFVSSAEKFELVLVKGDDWSDSEDAGNVHVVNLEKGNSGLGFSVQGGVGYHEDPQQCIVRVRKVYPVGPAAASGKLKEGDVLLQVDGHPLKHLSSQDVLTVLRRTENQVKLLVCRPEKGVLPELMKRDSPYPHLSDTRLSLSSKSTTPDAIDEPTASKSVEVSYERTDASGASTSARGNVPLVGELNVEETSTEEDEDNSVLDQVPLPGNDEFEDDSNAPGMFVVTLTKGDKGLGFTVAGGQHTTGYFYVKDILYEPALSADNIRPGDRLIKVNGVDMRGLNHKEAVAYLRQTPQTVTIQFYRSDLENEVAEITENLKNARKDQLRKALPPQMEEIEGELQERLGDRSMTPGSEGGDDKLMTTMSSWGETTLPIPDDENEVKLQEAIDNLTKHGVQQAGLVQVDLVKPVTGSLGISLVVGEKAGSSALFIRTVVPGSVADLEGTLRVGDRLLQVNGESVIGAGHSKAAALIRQAQSEISLVVARPVVRPNGSFNISQEVEEERRDSVDTDSDVDSATFDDEAEHLGGTVKLTGATGGALAETQVDPDEDSFCTDSDEEAYHKFVRQHTGPFQRRDDDLEDSFADVIVHKMSSPDSTPSKSVAPIKPPRKSTPIKSLPSSISDSWLQSQTVLQAPTNAEHYSGTPLQALIKSLRTALIHQDPEEEYKGLKHAKLTDNCNEARKPENRAKNRYRNVLPYDATRVCLSEPDDYINASHVKVQVGKDLHKYIACQGPLTQTTGDFWRMVWETNASVIAMVTLDMEAGKIKCHRYWPDSIGEPFTVYNKYEVSLSQVQSLSDFDVHHIKMEDLETGQLHRVIHLNFTSWPDQHSPDSALPLLQYLKFLHLVHTTGPIIVHCSAGIGRTGALITIDLMLAVIEKDLKFDIKRIVADLRRQRQGMIQTKEQYIFCYKAVLEALETLTENKTEEVTEESQA